MRVPVAPQVAPSMHLELPLASAGHTAAIPSEEKACTQAKSFVPGEIDLIGEGQSPADDFQMPLPSADVFLFKSETYGYLRTI